MQMRTQKVALLILLLLTTATLCIMAAVPPVSRDALTHHLLVPKLYLLHGGIYEIPQIVFSYYPMNLDLLYAAGMYMGNDILPTYIHMLFGLLTALLIYRYLRRRYGSVWGLAGALFFLTLPVIIKLCTTTYVDLGVIFFVFASLLALLKWHDSGARLRWLILAAAACGLALGTKYTAVLDYFFLTILVPVLYSNMRREQRNNVKSAAGTRDAVKALGWMVVFAAIAFAVFSPWAIKNYIWTQNPVYPLAQGFLNPGEHTANTDVFGNQGEGYKLSPLTKRTVLYGENLGQVLLVPIRVFLEGADDKPQYFDGRLNPALLIFSVMALLFIRGRTARYKMHDIVFFSYAALIVLTAWLTVDMRIRYICTCIAPLTVLTMTGARELWTYLNERVALSKRVLRWGVPVVLAAAFLANYVYLYQQFQKVEPLYYLSGKVTRDEYIQKFRPEYAALTYMNTNIPAGSKIFAIFLGNRMYYSDHFLEMRSQRFFDYVQTSADAMELASRLYHDGYMFFLFNTGLMNEFAKDFLDMDALMRLDAFLRVDCERIFSRDGYSLYRLKVGGENG